MRENKGINQCFCTIQRQICSTVCNVSQMKEGGLGNLINMRVEIQFRVNNNPCYYSDVPLLLYFLQ